MTVLACDLGGTRIKLGLVGDDGSILASKVLPAHADRPLAQRLPDISHALHSLCRGVSVSPRSCEGIGVSYPSVIDPSNGRILDEFGKYGAVDTDSLRGWARNEFGLPLAIDNDARMALIGEWQYGAGRGCNDLAIMTLGTGLGAAAVIGGQPLRGKHGQAGILGGHLTVELDGRPCVCGNRGCAEAEASTSVLAELARSRTDFPGSKLAQEGKLSYATVFRCADRGDPCAIELKALSLRIWGAMAVNLVHAYDPEVLILGGGIMGAAEVILPAIERRLRDHAHTPWGQVRVVASELADHAALAAARWLISEQIAKGA